MDSENTKNLLFISVYWIVWGVSLTIFLWFVLFILTGENFTGIRWISYVSPWLIMILLIAFIIALYLNKKKLAFINLIFALLIGLPYLPFLIPLRLQLDSNKNFYKIMTYNKLGRNHEVNAVASVVIKEKPDILLMQEISRLEVDSLVKILKPYYKNQLSFFSGHDFILSRFQVQEIKTKRSKNKSVIIKLPEEPIKVWNVHLRKSIFFTGKQYSMTDEIVAEIANEKQPIIVAGDFNATMVNYPYKKIKRYLKNAFEEVGFGFGFTFPSPARRMGTLTPFMRIDHIFFSNHFKVYNAYVVKDSGGSDHYPVVAILSLVNKS